MKTYWYLHLAGEGPIYVGVGVWQTPHSNSWMGKTYDETHFESLEMAKINRDFICQTQTKAFKKRISIRKVSRFTK